MLGARRLRVPPGGGRPRPAPRRARRTGPSLLNTPARDARAQEIAGADEIRDEAVPGVEIDFLGVADLDDPASLPSHLEAAKPLQRLPLDAGTCERLLEESAQEIAALREALG